MLNVALVMIDAAAAFKKDILIFNARVEGVPLGIL